MAGLIMANHGGGGKDQGSHPSWYYRGMAVRDLSRSRSLYNHSSHSYSVKKKSREKRATKC